MARRLKVARTIDEEIPRRVIPLFPWYYERIEMLWVVGSAAATCLALWPLLPGLDWAFGVAVVTSPFWFWVVHRWQKSGGGDPAYRWNTRYRLGLIRGKPGLLPRRRSVQILQPHRKPVQKAFSGAKAKRLGLSEAWYFDVAYPDVEVLDEEGQSLGTLLDQRSIVPGRCVRRVVRKPSPAPCWFQLLHRLPRQHWPANLQDVPDAWVVRPTIAYGVTRTSEGQTHD